ncbi:hypothetical protein A8H40_10765 (plasmid) [Burkholderia multivorans]|uniref:Uncharacterized protein n=1 Tax=Burkholderia multivorans TaxID=87883 RepID=A0A8E2UWE7_9BURK|nr:hypothetical protein A8H40_10765 [Burkholderia multivorans]EJO63291.1 hypothetical protein BURMUCF1_B0431 [Burkholderia multivorans ATCC BAA-247]PRD82698.1 hypothetical protein C6P76_24120 [Burkholderia multivorans]PRE22972.1 hypothetical protein C6P79_23550 [Burkholderia multivorans]PRF24096.1 hypothetical protein C6P98_12805 [Burkholderia multivorans]
MANNSVVPLIMNAPEWEGEQHAWCDRGRRATTPESADSSDQRNDDAIIALVCRFGPKPCPSRPSTSAT